MVAHTAQKRLTSQDSQNSFFAQKRIILSKGLNRAQLSHALLPSAGWSCARPPESLFTRIQHPGSTNLTWNLKNSAANLQPDMVRCEAERLKSFDTPTEGCLPSNIPGFKSQGPKAELLCSQSSSAKRKELLECVANDHHQGRHSWVTSSQHISTQELKKYQCIWNTIRSV